MQTELGEKKIPCYLSIGINNPKDGTTKDFIVIRDSKNEVKTATGLNACE